MQLGVPAYGMQANQRNFRDNWLALLRGLAFEELEFTLVGEIVEAV